MELSTVKSDLQQLLDVLASAKDCFEIVGNEVAIVGKLQELKAELTKINIIVNSDTLDFSAFCIPQVFLKTNYQQRIDPEMINTDFIVLDLAGKAVLHYGELCYNFNSGSTLEEVENAIAYYTIYNFFKSPDFADHHNSADEEIIIYSSAKGILKIKYQNIAPHFHAPVKGKVKKLLDALADQQFRTYFKNSLFDLDGGSYVALSNIITNCSIVLSAAKRDLELALRQFDFEKFRDALYSQKDKFFVAIREVLSKIYGQIVGIPISITAAVYATYKTEHTYAVPVLILASFILYVVIYTIIQWNYYKDIKEIQADFLRDFTIIKTQSGLPVDDVTKEYNKVDTKITATLRIAVSLMLAVIALGLAVSVFIITQLK